MDKTIVRFYSKTQPGENGCLIWTSGKTVFGYGMFQVGGKQWKAHRFAWSIKNGGIPDKLNVLHKCDNPSCVNQAHLFLGTHADNVADKIQKGRMRVATGEHHGRARLSVENVIEIRKNEGKETITNLSKKYGVARSVIRKVLMRITWKQIV